jgi:ADP-ribose pyrophosphatase
MTELRVLYEGKFLRVVSRDGWEYVERTRGDGAALIVAVTDAREIVLVEQYRPPLDARVIELPAGLVGDEDPAERDGRATAIRELCEETGFEADRWQRSITGPSSQGLSSEILHFFLASELRRTSDGGGVGDTERIAVHVIPLDGADAWLAARAAEGKLVDPRVYAGLYLATKNER